MVERIKCFSTNTTDALNLIRQHTSAYVSTRQITSAYISAWPISHTCGVRGIGIRCSHRHASVLSGLHVTFPVPNHLTHSFIMLYHLRQFFVIPYNLNLSAAASHCSYMRLFSDRRLLHHLAQVTYAYLCILCISVWRKFAHVFKANGVSFCFPFLFDAGAHLTGIRQDICIYIYIMYMKIL